MSIRFKNKFIKVGLVSLFGLTAFSFAVGHSIAKQEEPIAVEATSHPANFDSYTYSGSYYNNISSSATGTTLREALTTLIHPSTVPAYSSSGATHLSTVLQYADEDPTNSANMIYLYTRDSVKKNAASSWNREHVWPQSLSNDCWGTSRAGADLLHLRPTYNTTNSTRSNFPYGEISKTSAKVYNGITYGYQSNGYFMPLDSVKGDVARICMYVWTAYYEEYGSKLPALTKVFQSFDVLMQWHIDDQPDVMEGNRNDYAETSMQKNRNPFVDHPEFAWKVFGSNCSTSVLNAAKAAYPEGGTTGGSVTMSQSSANMAPTETIQLSAKSSDSSQISWSTSDSTVASISANKSASETPITVTANAEGTATIYASATIGGEQRKASCSITVTSTGGGGGGTTGNVYTIGWGTATGTAGTYSNYETTSGDVSGILNFSCAKNSASNDPAFNSSSSELRLYYASTGNGGSITITPSNGITFTRAVVTASTSPSVKYSVDSGSATSVTTSNNVYTINNISASSSLMIQNANTSNTQLRIKTIQLTYDDSSATVATLKSIAVTGQTQNYVVGDEFEFDGVCTATYTDGSTKTVTPTSVSSPIMSSTGNKTIIVTYSEDDEEVTTSYIICVAPRSLSSIELDGQTTNYSVGDTFSFDGYVTAHYSNAEDDLVEPTSVSSPDMSTAGSKTVTVSYTENGTTKTATYTITVVALVVEEIAITAPSKTTYFIGDSLDLTGLEVIASYTNGDIKDVTASASVSSPDMSTAGTKTVTVTYGGKSETFTVTVSAVTLSSIAVSNQKTSYIVGSTFVKPTVIATFNNSTTNDVTESATFSGYNLSNTGSQTVTVSYTYGGITKTATYSITVSEESSHTYPVPGETTAYYQKVTSSNNLTSGDYLIVYETGNVAFNGGLETLEAANNTISVTISNNKITANATTNAAKFTINTTNGSLKSASNLYVGATTYANKLVTSNTVIENGFDIDENGNALITVSTSGGTVTMKYNDASDQQRFRYYKSGQQDIQLYKYVEESTGPTVNRDITSISVSTTKSNYHPGETFDQSAVTVTAYYEGGSFVPTSGITYSLSSSYMFTYSDTGSGSSTKSVEVSFAGWTENLSLSVSRVAYSKAGSETLTLTGAQFSTAGVGSSSTTGNFTVNGLSVYVYSSYIYSSKLSLSTSKTSAEGYVQNNVKGNAIENITISGSSVPIKLSVDGSTWTDLDSANTADNNYFYFFVGYSSATTTSNYINISSITITYKVDTAVTLSNYVMYEDTNNQCTNKFTVAAGIFNSLSSSEKNTFMTSNDYVIATARERLQAWAAHEGKSITYTNNEYVLAAIKYNQLLSINDNNVVILIVVSSLTALLSLGAYIVLRKRRGMNK